MLTAHQSTGVEDGSRVVRHGAVTVVVCIALAAVVAAMSSLNVAIPDIARSTHATQTQLAWVIDSYSLAFAALLLPAGAIGDRFGRRLTLLIGLAVFGLGSLLATMASDPRELIALRAVIGVGAALVMPATLSTITGTFPADRRARAVAMWAAVAGGAAVLGVLCSGILLEFFSWQAVFVLNVTLAVVAIVGVLRVVPESSDPQAPPLDLGGAALSVIALFALVYSIIEAPTVGWASARTLGGIALGLVVLAAFVAHELRHPTPMLDPRVFARPELSAGSLTVLVQFFAFFGFIFLILQFLQLVRADSALVAALSMLPMALTMMPAARLAPTLARKVGSRNLMVGGLLLIASALVVIAQVDASTHYWVLAVGLLVLGAGMGCAMTPATSAITAALPRAEQGVASAINDLSRELGGAVGIAVLGSVMAASYRSALDLPGASAEATAAARNSVAAASRMGADVAARADLAFVHAVHTALYTASATLTVVAGVVFIVSLRGSTKPPAPSSSLPLTHAPAPAEVQHR